MNTTDASLTREPQGPRVSHFSPAPVATIVTDAAGVIVSFSTEAERLFHSRAADTVGLPLGRLITPLPEPFPTLPDGDCAGGLFHAHGRHSHGTSFPLEITLALATLGSQRIVMVTLRPPQPSSLVSHFPLEDDQYCLFFEHSPLPMWVYDEETLCFLTVNQTAKDDYGFSHAEFLSMTAYDLHLPEDRPEFIQRLARIKGQAEARSEGRHRRKDNSVLWVEVASHAIVYEGRRARLVAATDTTARRHAEETLHEREERLRMVVNQAPLLLCALDRDGGFTLSEGQALEAMGRKPGDAVGHSFFERLKDVPDAIRDARRALGGEAARSVRHIGGKAFDISYTPIKDEAGQVTGVIGVGVDITDRLRIEHELRHAHEALEARVQERTSDLEVINDYLHFEIAEREQAEAALRESEARFRTIAEATPVAITITRQSDSSFLFANAHFRSLVGLPSDAPLTGLFAQNFYAEQHNRDEFMEAIRRDGRVRNFEVRMQRLDGCPFWVAGSLQQIMFGGEAVIFAAYDDVTDRKRSEEALRRAEMDLLCSNRDLMQAYDATIEGWSHALDLRDHETEGHTRRVTEMTLHLARVMQMDQDDLIHVRRGALLHDIGKMGIPDRILLKPAPLTEDEWGIMRRHPQYALEMLSPITFLHPALDIPFCHHEKWDGTGYPRGLQGEEIPLAARVFCIADVWDALRSNRPYRQGWPADRVREHVRALSGQHFDPAVVEAFLQMDLSEF